MRTLAEDTSPEMEAVLIGLLRKRTPAQKVGSFVNLRRMAKQLMLGNIRTQYPEATEFEIYRQLHTRCFGRAAADKIFSNGKVTLIKQEAEMLNEMEILLLVGKRLEALKIPYYVGGGVASINYGEPRLTNDADVVMRIFPFHVPHFVKALENEFVVSADAVQDAMARRYAFNIIHIETAYKIDFYPITDEDEMASAAFARQQRINIGAGEIWMASAEDVILAKLRWFRKGGEVSEKQWRDVLGVLKVQGERLEFAYLESMAGRFGLADLLKRARDDAGTV